MGYNQKVHHKIVEQPFDVPENWHFFPSPADDGREIFLGRLVAEGYIVGTHAQNISGCGFHFIFASEYPKNWRTNFRETFEGGLNCDHFCYSYTKQIHVIQKCQDEFKTNIDLLYRIEELQKTGIKVKIIADVVGMEAENPAIQNDLFSTLDRSNKCPVCQILSVEEVVSEPVLPKVKRFYQEFVRPLMP